MAAIPVEHLDMEYVDAWLERQINAYEASSGQGSYDQFKNMIIVKVESRQELE